MKTLDEVIDAMERCSIPHYFDCKGCPYEDDDAEVGCRSDDRDAHVLHYLKAFRDAKDALDTERDRYAEAVRNCEVTENKYKRLCKETSQKLRNTSQITCPKCHSEFLILDDPDGDHQQLLKCQALLQDFYRNVALSWDELQQMEGKPVWVEEENQPSQWYLIDEVETDEDDDPEFVKMTVFDCQGDCWFYKNNMGTKWQAYRKELKNV